MNKEERRIIEEARPLSEKDQKSFGLKNFAQLREKLLSDQEWRLQHLYYVKDGEARAAKFVQLKFRETQKNLYDKLWHRTCVVKSRQHGITTFGLIYALDLCIFQEGSECGMLAHKRTESRKFVDRLKSTWSRISDDVLEIAGVDRKLPKKSSGIFGLSNGSSVESSTSFRGSTMDFMHISEYANICKINPQLANEVMTGTLESVKQGSWIIYESTSEGPSGDFWNIANEALANNTKKALQGINPTPMDPILVFLPWYEKPSNTMDAEYVDTKYAEIDEKTHMYLDSLDAANGIILSRGQRAWYYAKKKVLGEISMFYEHPSTFEEAFTPRAEGSIFGSSLVSLRQKGFIGKYVHNPALPVYTFSDLGTDGSAFWFVQQGNSGEAIVIDYFGGHGEDFSFYARNLLEIAKKKNYAYQFHWTGHDIVQSQYYMFNTQRLETTRQMGINFQACEKITRKEVAVSVVMTFLQDSVRFDEENCKDGLRSLSGVRRSRRRDGSFTDVPVHDKNSHAADALMYLSMRWLNRNSSNTSLKTMNRVQATAIKARYRNARHAREMNPKKPSNPGTFNNNFSFSPFGG